MTLDLPTAPPSTVARMEVTRRPEAVFTRGRGSWRRDSQGRRYLDLVQRWAVNTLGRASPQISAALAALSGLDRVFFTGSGAKANEGVTEAQAAFPAGTAGPVRRTRPAADNGRSADRRRPHGHAEGSSGIRCAARHHDAGQGAGRWRAHGRAGCGRSGCA